MTGRSNIAALRAMFPLLPTACMRGPGQEPRLRSGVWLAVSCAGFVAVWGWTIPQGGR